MSTKRKYCGPLDTAIRCRREMGRVYREARNGELEPAELKGFIYALSEIRKAISEGEFELRLDRVEDAVKHHRSLNGSAEYGDQITHH